MENDFWAPTHRRLGLAQIVRSCRKYLHIFPTINQIRVEKQVKIAIFSVLAFSMAGDVKPDLETIAAASAPNDFCTAISCVSPLFIKLRIATHL